MLRNIPAEICRSIQEVERHRYNGSMVQRKFVSCEGLKAAKLRKEEKKVIRKE